MAFHDYIKKSGGDEILFLFSALRINKPGAVDRHTANEISLFRGGSGEYTINGQAYEFSSDDVFIMPSNVTHAITRVDKPTQFYNLYFDPVLIWDSNNFFDIKYLSVFRGDTDNFRYKLDKTNSHYGDILDSLEDILYEYSQKEAGYRHMVKAHLLALLVLIHRYFDYGKGEYVHVNKHVISDVARAMEYIDQHYYKDISLADIARSANLSPTYFGIVFKKLNGITPWEYVMSKWVNLAMSKIANEDYSSMKDVALNCGFNSTASLNRAFRKYSGVTPGRTLEVINKRESGFVFNKDEIGEGTFCDSYEG